MSALNSVALPAYAYASALPAKPTTSNFPTEEASEKALLASPPPLETTKTPSPLAKPESLWKHYWLPLSIGGASLLALGGVGYAYRKDMKAIEKAAQAVEALAKQTKEAQQALEIKIDTLPQSRSTPVLPPKIANDLASQQKRTQKWISIAGILGTLSLGLQVVRGMFGI